MVDDTLGRLMRATATNKRAIEDFLTKADLWEARKQIDTKIKIKISGDSEMKSFWNCEKERKTSDQLLEKLLMEESKGVKRSRKQKDEKLKNMEERKRQNKKRRRT